MRSRPGLRLSAIVPTLDEVGHIGPCIDRLRNAGVAEVIVVDGGSSDGTPERAVPKADRVLEATGGLFEQLNCGARAASGEVLLFHYADGLIPESGVDGIADALADPGVAGGAFRLGFDSDRTAYRVIAGGANLRNRLGFGPFGDQSIFVRTRTFVKIGGFDARAYLADFELVRGIKREGRFRILPVPVRTSVRRWEQDGVVITLLRHWKLSLAWFVRGARSNRTREIEGIRRVR